MLLVSSTRFFLITSYFKNVQVQEKKLKKILQLNLDHSHPVGNGSIVSASASSCLPNGGSSEKHLNYVGHDVSFPSGGISSLHLPVVVVPNPFFIYVHAYVLFFHIFLSFTKHPFGHI